jgi:cell division protein FtsW
MTARVPKDNGQRQEPHWLEPASERRRAARPPATERRSATPPATERRRAATPAAPERRAAAAETPAERRAAERRAGQRRGEGAADQRPARDPGEPERRAAAERRSAARRRAAAPGATDRAVLLTTTCLLLLYGLVMAYSASTAKAFFSYGSSWYLIERQAFFAVVGVIAMIVLARVDYVFWRRVATPLWLFALLSLLVVLVPGIGTTVNGARRWIIVAGFSYSPSELAKLSCVMLVAGLIHKRPADVLTAGGFARLVALGVGPAAVLIMAEPDLGTTIILVLSVIAVVVAAGARVRHLVTLGSAAAAAVALAIVVEPYRMARLTSFINPWKDPRGAGMQTVQSLISIASGHLFGVGLGNSIQKFGFLPEQTTDSITGIIGEELGLIGLLVLIALYVALVWTIFRIALRSREPYGKLLAAGIGSAIGVQAAVNIGAALGVLPLTGVPLPLVSFGGTSLVVVLAGVGIVANIASNRRSYIVASTERHSRPRGGGRDGGTSHPGSRGR